MSKNHTNSLPTERDFDPWNGNLDAQSAWKNFGGLTLDEAHIRFRENPIYFQEDFMFMGGKAFAYYFPVIESWLQDVPDADSCDDNQASILAHCLKMQFEGDNLTHVRHLAPRILHLAAFVLKNIRRFGADDRERQRVADAWTELTGHIGQTTDSPTK
jgi:hypothetical protein